jgi:hypothetical protein
MFSGPKRCKHDDFEVTTPLYDQYPDGDDAWFDIIPPWKADDDNEVEDACIICLDPMKPDEITSTECDHRFHSDCLATWVRRVRTCPTCRTPIGSQTVNSGTTHGREVRAEVQGIRLRRVLDAFRAGTLFLKPMPGLRSDFTEEEVVSQLSLRRICEICYKPLQVGKGLRPMNCDHAFHATCIKTDIRRQREQQPGMRPECPNARCDSTFNFLF